MLGYTSLDDHCCNFDAITAINNSECTLDQKKNYSLEVYVSCLDIYYFLINILGSVGLFWGTSLGSHCCNFDAISAINNSEWTLDQKKNYSLEVYVSCPHVYYFLINILG